MLVELGKPKWKAFFDNVSRTLGISRPADIEVDGLKLGHQVEAQWVKLLGMSYDPKDDVFSVAVEGIEHLIHEPRKIHVDHDAAWLHSVEVIDSAGDHHIVILKDALSLPAPESSAPTRPS